MAESRTATGVQTVNGNGRVSKRGTNNNNNNNTTTSNDATVTDVEPPNATTAEKLRKMPQKKYRHVAAVHSKTRSSCLSHDADVNPSFLGFRNLMVIVLGE
jgi:diacylglycerol O-acyltransferase-1